MTTTKFISFNRKHKPKKITNSNFGGFKIKYDNGEVIVVSSGYDGMIYTHQSEIIKTKDGNIKLLKDLNEMAPHFLKNIQDKYSEPTIF